MGGSAGHEVGARSQLAMTRCASRKLRKSAASSMSWRKRRRKRRRGSELHAMASVTAVKIQWSSPSGERRSLSLPG